MPFGVNYGHYCLLIIAQGRWKESYKERLVIDINIQSTYFL